MGVTGLWRLIEPAGKPVPLETLENRVLAVDISIWLHQAVKGFQDAQGAPLPNAHLLGIYHRVCKLLYFKVKPVFVFDGGVPNLKKETISKRNQQKSKKLTEAERIQKQLLDTLLKHSAVNKVLSEKAKATLSAKATAPSKTSTKTKTEDIYKLPPSELDSTLTTSDDETTSESTFSSSPTKHWDLHTIDEKSPHFKALPVDVRHDILTELKETRKQSSWGRIHQMPKKSDDFSGFQMKRLLKRYSVQVSLEEVEKEMGGRSLSLAELETLLKDQGVVTSSGSIGSRIASDESTRYVLIKDVKKALDEARKQEEKKQNALCDIEEEEVGVENNGISEGKNHESEYKKDLETAIQLSLEDVPSTSSEKTEIKSKPKLNFSFLDNFNDADFRSSSESEDDSSHKNKASKNVLASAKSYMMEYSGLTPNEIAKIMAGKVETAPSHDDVKINDKTINKLKEVEDKIVETVEDTVKIPSSQNEVLEINVNSNEAIDSTNTANQPLDEVMSGHSSDDSNDFLEVSEKSSVNNKEESGFEIVIKPADSLDDDLFDDIFSNKQNEEEPSNQLNIGMSKKEVSVSEEPEASNNIEINEEHSLVVVGNENVEEKEAILKEDDVPKQEHVKKVIEELIKPLPQREDFKNNKDTDERTVLTTEQLKQIEKNLHEEKEGLIAEKLSKERMASSLTEQIYQEAQELLQLFGVPYITAPMEAEAQCAFLDDINLTDGTITDDSDIWLFGGKTVYKNFFNQHKVVMEYQAENILHHFKLSREQMILLALLVGSDYTIGLQGIGPVTALEILAAFPPSKAAEFQLTHQQVTSGLESFRKWLTGERIVGPGRTALRNKLKNVVFTESFPSLQVVRAYLEPTIDSSKEPFSWAKPDITGLVAFARQKFGWNQTKSEEILKPVLKRLNESRTQKSIKDYFSTKHKVDSGEAESKMSKRVKRAVNRIGKDPSDQLEQDTNKKEKPKRPAKRKAKKKTEESSTNSVKQADTAGLSSDEDVQILKKTCTESEKKVQQINSHVRDELQQFAAKAPGSIASLHKKEVIPQREQRKLDALRKKMKAIEIFRKSKQGPGYVEKRKAVKRQPKEDAELSESSSD